MVRPRQLGHLVLRVRDLDRSERFYTDVLDLDVTTKIPDAMVFMSAGEASHELALMSVGADAPGPEPDRVGLYHFAWEMAAFYELPRNQWPEERNIFSGKFPLGSLEEEPAARPA